MRGLAIAVAVSALLCACDDAPAGDPSSPRPLDEKLRKPPPAPAPMPVAPSPAPAVPDAGLEAGSRVDTFLGRRRDWKPWNDTRAPSALALEGDFELTDSAGNGLSMYSGSHSVRGDASGATVISAVTCHRCGADQGYFRGRLSAEKSKALIAALKKLRFWALNDAVDMMVMDATGSELHVRLGKVSHDVKIYASCPCDHRRPTEEQVQCECPQLTLWSLLVQAKKDAAPAVLPAVKVLPFSAPKPKQVLKTKGTCRGTAKEGYSCHTGATEKALGLGKGTWAQYFDLAWCSPKGTSTFSCFESPFATRQFDVEFEKPVEEDPSRDPDHRPSPQALVLASGDRCATEPHREPGWKCEKNTLVGAVLPAGTTWVALGEGGKELPLSAVYLR